LVNFWVSFWLNHRLAGAEPLAWHLPDVAIHAGCPALLFLCLARIAPRRPTFRARTRTNTRLRDRVARPLPPGLPAAPDVRQYERQRVAIHRALPDSGR